MKSRTGPGPTTDGPWIPAPNSDQKNNIFLDAQIHRNKTKTNQREEITMENRVTMMNNGLRYEIDLYYFVRALFNTKLDHYGINRATPIATR